jgi:hypothetical protein
MLRSKSPTRHETSAPSVAAGPTPQPASARRAPDRHRVSPYAKAIATIASASIAAMLAVACGSSGSTFPPGGENGDNVNNPDNGNTGQFGETETPNPDAFWAKDPPPQWCGPDNAPAPQPPGGTPDCPDDKNREGCPCPEVGMKAKCWPGLRANRNLGICQDGEVECVRIGEVQKVWGACKGYVLPKPGATKGKDACKCFSAGKWDIENVRPCIYWMTTRDNVTRAESTQSTGACRQQNEQASAYWSKNTLTVDCAGTFRLCYTVKAGNIDDPKPTDQVLGESCTEGNYPVENVPTEFPPLPHWQSGQAPAKAFYDNGGYGELTVKGLSVRCDPVDDGAGNRFVFQRIKYCPFKCNDPGNETLPECVNCRNGATGNF